MHRHVTVSSVIVQVIHIDRRAVLEPEGYAPGTRYRNRPVPFQATLQLVQAKPREVRVLGSAAEIERCQNVPQLLDMRRRHAPRRLTLEDLAKRRLGPLFQRVI